MWRGITCSWTVSYVKITFVLWSPLFVIGALKRNRAEFDWETNCQNRILKYVTRWLLTNQWKIPVLESWTSLITTGQQTSFQTNRICILKKCLALNRVTPSKAKIRTQIFTNDNLATSANNNQITLPASALEKRQNYSS